MSRRLRLIVLVAAAAGAFVAAVLLLPHSPAGLRVMIAGAGAAGPAIALAGWVVLTPAMLSGALLAAASGLAFGPVGGIAVSIAGAVLGGLAAFGLARAAGRSQIEAGVLRRPRLQKLHAMLEERGFMAALAARLMPGVPATGLHYVAGVSPIRVPAFCGAMAIGALLRTAPYAVLGDGVAGGSIVSIAVAAASIAVGGLTAGLIVRRLRRPALAV
jgi:uncharacterized membrane protein YdjX (TVP38/TMEM64 family)